MIRVCSGGQVNIVPCGKCAFCLQNNRSQWMFRIYHEMRNQLHRGWFLTLTYDEKHVKRVSYVDPDTGQHVRKLSLRFRDVQLFLKRVRKAKYYVKYIIVGEYGSQTYRPHYHCIFWTDCPIDELTSFWRMGHIDVGQLTMQSAMYTLKYIIQPKQRAIYGVEKTRAQFSKGLGISYLDTATYNYHTDNYDSPVLFSVIDGNKVALPRYYKKKIFTKHQMRVEAYKNQWKTREKHCAKLSEYLRRGIRPRDAVRHMNVIRAERARRIVEKTKYNLKL